MVSVRDKFVYRYIAPPSFYNIYQMVTQSLLSMFLISASVCVLNFRGIQTTESLMLKAGVIPKIISVSSCIFSCYLFYLQLNKIILQNYQYIGKNLSRILESNESLLILYK